MTGVTLPVPLPTGRWAVGVSGGADSVALLRLLCDAPGVSPHVVHLDHQTRPETAADAAFVADLASRLGVPATVAVRSDVERDLGDPPANPSARYRWARLALFRRVVAGHGLAGVVLAHHADDQAETVFLRLLRGGGVRALGGMAERSVVGGLVVVRPLLRVPSGDLRRLLRDRRQPWREDASNASDQYLRNRVRRALAGDPPLSDALRELATAARAARDWLDARSPALADAFATADLAVAAPLARHAAGRWLAARGAPPDAVNRATCDRLVALAADAATPARQSFPGGLDVRRAGGRVTAAAAGATRRPPPAR